MNTPIRFRGFDKRADVAVYEHGTLPHWQQRGCTYFVTFRQADALPQSVVRRIEQERRQWLIAKDINPHESNWVEQFGRLCEADRRDYERLVGNLINKNLDQGYGSCHLENTDVAEVVESALTYFDGSRVDLGDFVIMPNHVHALMQPLPGYELHEVLHSIKSYSANQINLALQLTGAFWQRQSYDHIVRDFEQLEAYQRYIAANPTMAGVNVSRFVHRSVEYTE